MTEQLNCTEFKLKFVQKQPICRVQPTFFFFFMKKIKDIGYFYQQNLALTIRSLHLVMEFPLSLDLPFIAMIEERTGKRKAVVVSDFIIYHQSYLGHRIPLF